MRHRLSRYMLWKAFSKSKKLIFSCLRRSVRCSMMLGRMKIWSIHSCWSTVSAVRGMTILTSILLGTDSKLIPRQLLQLLRTSFFGISTMTPSVQSSDNLFPSQTSVMSGLSRSAASCGSLWNTSALILSFPGEFPFLRDLVAAMISSFLGDGCWHPGLSLPLVYLALLAVAVSSKFHWSVPFMLRPARLLWWAVAAAGPSSEHQCQLYMWHTAAWWSYRFCVALPYLLHLLPGLVGRLCGSASLFLPSSSLFGSLPSIVACISPSVALIWPSRLSSWEFFSSQWPASYPLRSTPSSFSALFQERPCRSARRLS